MTSGWVLVPSLCYLVFFLFSFCQSHGKIGAKTLKILQNLFEK